MIEAVTNVITVDRCPRHDYYNLEQLTVTRAEKGDTYVRTFFWERSHEEKQDLKLGQWYSATAKDMKISKRIFTVVPDKIAADPISYEKLIEVLKSYGFSEDHLKHVGFDFS